MSLGSITISSIPDYAIMSTIMLKIKEFFKQYETKIVLVLGLILATGFSFQAGYLKGQNLPQNPLVIETPGNCPDFQEKGRKSQNNGSENTSGSTLQENSTQKQGCMFVGSKNSDKYHLPDCKSAKRIKPENLVCFESSEDAVSKGYEPSKDCLK